MKFGQNIHLALRNKSESGISSICGYSSCDSYECNRVGELIDTVTLQLYKKITNKN